MPPGVEGALALREIAKLRLCSTSPERAMEALVLALWVCGWYGRPMADPHARRSSQTVKTV